MRKKNKLVYGVGVNDADYEVNIKERYTDEFGKTKTKLLWCCPFYRAWTDMLRRACSQEYKQRFPTYRSAVVCEEWHLFSNFKCWMGCKDFTGKVLDKDLLVKDNKIYSPGTCCFIEASVNSFLTERQNDRGDYPIGVHFDKSRGKFSATISNPFTGKTSSLGRFETPQEAHDAWRTKKLEFAKLLSDEIFDPIIANALISRYENYGMDGIRNE